MRISIRDDRIFAQSNYVFGIIGDIYDPDTKEWDPNGTHMIRQQDFWFVVGMTVFVLIPWLTVREVKVDIEIVSLLYFHALTHILTESIAFAQSCRSALRTRHATRPSGSH